MLYTWPLLPFTKTSFGPIEIEPEEEDEVAVKVRFSEDEDEVERRVVEEEEDVMEMEGVETERSEGLLTGKAVAFWGVEVERPFRGEMGS